MIKAKIGSATPVKAAVRLVDGIQAGWSVWREDRAYLPLEKVSRLGSSYICTNGCTGVDPTVDVGKGVQGQYWLLIAKKGDDGVIRFENLDDAQKQELKGKDGVSVVVDGTTATGMVGGGGVDVSIDPATGMVTVKAKTVEEWTFTLEDDSTVTKKVVLV